jgi:hypothetical protein
MRDCPTYLGKVNKYNNVCMWLYIMHMVRERSQARLEALQITFSR